MFADGDAGGCNVCAGSLSISIVSHGQTLHAVVVADSNVVSKCFVGSLWEFLFVIIEKWQRKKKKENFNEISIISIFISGTMKKTFYL